MISKGVTDDKLFDILKSVELTYLIDRQEKGLDT